MKRLLITMLLSLFLSLGALSSVIAPAYASDALQKVCVYSWLPHIDADGAGPAMEAFANYASKNKINYEIEIMPWAQAYALVKKGVICNYSVAWLKTPEREEEVDFVGQPIFQDTTYIYYNAHNFPEGHTAKSLEDLNGRKVAAIEAWWHNKPLKEAGAQIYSVHRLDAAFRLLYKGVVDALVLSDLVFESLYTEYDEPKYLKRTAEPIFKKEYFIIATKK